MGLMLLLVISVAAVLSGVLLTVRASDSQVTAASNELTTVTTTPATATVQAATEEYYTVSPPWMCMSLMPGFGRGPRGFGGFGAVEVSSDFVQNVTNIAKSDTDVQQLLNNGYNITRVMPIIKTMIDANGNVVMKATNATVLLEKENTGRAFVSVDLEQGKVTRVVILTKTVIEKP